MDKTICPNCTGETVVDGYCHNCGAGTKPEVEEDLAQSSVEVLEKDASIANEEKE